MNILHRYIAKTIISSCIMVVMIVTGLSFVIRLLGELRDIGNGDYTFFQAVLHVVLRMPFDLYQFFPTMVLLGAVLGLGALSANQELVAMRTAGMSIRKVVGAVIVAACVLVLFATFLGEGLAPSATFLSDKRKDSAVNSGQAVSTIGGIWMHAGNNFFHIDRIIGRHKLEGVKRFEFDGGNHLLASYSAKSIIYQNGHWDYQDLDKTIFNLDHTYSEHIDHGTWEMLLNPNLLNVGMVSPEELSLHKLALYSKELVQNRLQANRFQFEFWRRVFQPFTTLVMVLLAIPFIFSGPRSTTMGLRILSGVLLGFVFYILNSFLGQFSVVFQITPWKAALIPTILFAMASFVFIQKVK